MLSGSTYLSLLKDQQPTGRKMSSSAFSFVGLSNVGLEVPFAII
jgi:hypothetical protein